MLSIKPEVLLVNLENTGRLYGGISYEDLEAYLELLREVIPGPIECNLDINDIEGMCERYNLDFTRFRELAPPFFIPGYAQSPEKKLLEYYNSQFLPNIVVTIVETAKKYSEIRKT